MSARIQQIYIAMFGRPADPIGLQSWNTTTNNGANLTPMINALAGTAEYQARYTGLTNVQAVNAIYQSLFGRDADVAGLTFFVNELASGRQTVATIAVNILDGAQGTDKARIDNKVIAATNFTTAVNTTAEILAYNASAIPAAQAFLTPITDVATTIPTAAATDAAIAAIVSGSSGVAGQTFALTTSQDTLTGTSGSDIFTATLDAGTPATADTLTAFDSINGGAGTDTLVIDGLSVAIAAGNIDALGLTRTSIENLTVNNTAATALNAADIGTSATKVTLNGTSAVQTVTLADAVTEVSAKTTAAVTITGNAGADVLTTVSLENVAAASTIVSDKLSALTLKGVSATVGNTAAAATRTLTVNAENVSGAAAALDATATTLNVNASGTVANVLALTATAATEINVNATNSKGTTLTATNFTAAKTLNSTGTGDLTIDVSGAGALTKVDASTASGKNAITIAATAVTVNGGSGADTITQAAALGATQKISTGKGNDSVVLGGALTAGAVVDGGDGEDNFTLTSAVATGAVKGTQDKVFTSFEQLTVSDALGAALNMTNLNDIQKVVFNAASNNTLSGLNSGASVTYKAATGGTSAVVVTGAAGSASDVINLTFNTGGVTAFGQVTVADVETINILNTDGSTATTDVAAAIDTLTLVATSATSVVVTGNNGLNLTNTGNTKITNFDASAIKADTALDTAANLGVTFASANTTAAATVTIKGGAGNDALTGNASIDIIDGGAGNDTIIGGSGNDTLTGGAGDDTITGGIGNDTIDGGVGIDTINSGIGSDAITLGDGTDTVAFVMTAAVTGLATVTDFSAGTSTTAVDKVSVTSDGAGWSAAAVVKSSTAAGVVDARLVILDGGNFGSLADAAAAADNLHQNAAVKEYLFAWTDSSGTVYISHAKQDAATEVAIDQYVNLTKLTGVTLSNLDLTDFTFA